MKTKELLILLLLLGMQAATVHAGTPVALSGDEQSYREALKATTDRAEQGLLRKKLGMLYVSREQYDKAAEELFLALSLSPQAFTDEERVRTARYLSWSDKLKDAEAILRSVLSGAPENIEARDELAKVLSWSDRLGEAIAEADRVLAASPGDRQALLVKANALRWQGKSKESITLYQKNLSAGEDFDARLGLAHAYLDTGNGEAARENGALLKPRTASHEKELSKLQDAFCAEKPIRPGVQYAYYSDSDENRVNRYALFSAFRMGAGEYELRYGFLEAQDPKGRERVEELSMNTSLRKGIFSAGAGLATAQQQDNGRTTVGGHARVDSDLGWGTAGVSAAREVLTDTAQLIRNGITREVETSSLTQRPLAGLLFAESYSHAEYSDDNSADDAHVSLKYTVKAGGARIAAGYRYRYWNFKRQSGGGYFDPHNFTAHLAVLSLYAEHDKFYFFAEPYAGRQEFTRYGARSFGNIAGASASAGWNMLGCSSLEISAEGGNYAGATASGFSYSQVGFRLILYI